MVSPARLQDRCQLLFHRMFSSDPSEPDSRLRFVLVPISLVTHTVSLQATAMKKYVAPLETPLSKFSILLLGYLFDLLVQKLNYTAMNLHDPLCIGFFIDLESEADYTQVGWKVRERDIRIEADGRLTRGMLVVDRRIKSTKEAPGEPSNTQVVVQADAERYLASMFYDIWGASYP